QSSACREKLNERVEVALNAVRIHGGYGYSTEFDVERYFRDAPLMIVGEGTNEIQRNVIARQLIKRNSVAPCWAVLARGGDAPLRLPGGLPPQPPATTIRRLGGARLRRAPSP